MQIVVRVLNLGLGAIVTALVARALGKEGYGQWSTMFVTLSLVSFFANLGIETIALREAARQPEKEREWIGSAVLLRLISIGPVALASCGAILLLQQNHTMLLAGLILVVAMPLSGVRALQLVFELQVNNRVPMLILSLRSVLWGGGVVVVYLTGAGMVALAIAMSATDVICATLGAFAALRLLGGWPGLPRRKLGSLLKGSLPVGVSGLLVIAYGRIDQVIVFGMLGAGSAGLYGSANTLIEQAQFIPISILTTLAPVMAAAWPDRQPRMLRAVRLTAELMAVMSLGGLAFTLVGSREIVDVIFGAQFAHAASVLPILVGAFMLMSFGYLTDNLLVTMGMQRQMMLASLVTLVVNVAGNLVLIPVLGIVGAAWMTLFSELVVLLLSTAMIMRRLSLPIPTPGRISRTVVAAALLWGELSALRSIDASLVTLLLGACLGYPLLLLVMRAITPSDIRLILRREQPA